MKVLDMGKWIHYISDDYYEFLECYIGEIGRAPYDPEIGKWLIFCGQLEHAERICSLAVENCGVREAKHSADFSTGNGVCCFYMDADDISTNKKFLSYFKDNNLLPKTKKGLYVNLAFKFDIETKNGLYGEDFTGSIHLKDYLDLESGEWTDYFLSLEKDEIKKKTIRDMSHEYTGNLVYGTEAHLRNDDSINTKYIKEEIKKQGKTIKEIASFLEVKEATVRAWINGKAKPLVGNAMGLCLCLGLNVSSVIVKKES